MDNQKIALIGSAELPKGLLTAVTRGGQRQPKIYALTRGAQAGPGVHALAGSFLDASKIEAAVRAASLVVYAPSNWRAWIPAWFARGLRYTLLAAGWSGARSVIVVPPVAVSPFLKRLLVPLQARVLRRAEGILRRLPAAGIEWRLMRAEDPRPLMAPALSTVRRHPYMRCVPGTRVRDRQSYVRERETEDDVRSSA